jgi:hypothetical protein
VQYVNNVVYNWGVTGLVGGHSAADHWTDVINNYFVKGPSSNNSFVGQFANTDKVYQTGNFFDDNKNGKLDGREAVASDFKPATIEKSAGVVPTVSVRVDSAEAAFEKVLDGAGASLHRDAVDARLIESARSLGTAGKIIHDEKEIGGHPRLKGGEAKLDYPADAGKVEDFLNSLVK